MQNSIHHKIRLLLNELAILNQPETISDAIVYSDDILLKIKQLSAELYVNSELALIRYSMPETQVVSTTDTNTSIEAELQAITVTPVEQQTVAEEIETVAEEGNAIIETEPEVQIAEAQVSEAEVIATPIIESVAEPVLTEVEPEVKKAEIQVPPAEIISHDQSSHSVDISSKISLTRRFEYINNLFGGDASAFSEFLKNVALFGSISQSLEYFDSEFDKRNWKRKEESAAEFKSIIRKALQ